MLWKVATYKKLKEKLKKKDNTKETQEEALRRTFLHTNTFARRPFATQTLLRTIAFTHKRF